MLVEEEKTAFETWHRVKHPSLSLVRGGSREYASSQVQSRWNTWLARAAVETYETLSDDERVQQVADIIEKEMTRHNMIGNLTFSNTDLCNLARVAIRLGTLVQGKDIHYWVKEVFDLRTRVGKIDNERALSERGIPMENIRLIFERLLHDGSWREPDVRRALERMGAPS